MAAAGQRASWRVPAIVPVGVGVVLWGANVGLQPLSDNSFLTHLATGRLILSSGRVPRVDPYSYTAPGAEWVVQSWLASAVYGAVERLFGAGGLLWLHGLLFAALAALIVALTRPADGLIARVGLCGLAMTVGAGLWSERPLIFGLILFGVTLLVAERGRDPRALVVVFALWVNLHGSFPLGIVVLLCVAAGAALDREPHTHLVRCIAWAGLGIILGGINPIGPRLIQFPIDLLSRAEVLEGVTEWQAPAFQSTDERLWLLQLVLAILLLARRPSYRHAIPLVVFAAAGLLAFRNLPMASLVMLPGMAIGVQGFGAVSVRTRSLMATVTGLMLGAVGAVVVLAASQRAPFDLTSYPVAHLALAGEILGEDARIVVPDVVGNYQTVVAGAEARVFYDDRFDMYSPELAAAHRTLHAGVEGWESVLAQYDADAVIWSTSRPLAQLLTLSPDWQIAAVDEDWTLAVRRMEAT